MNRYKYQLVLQFAATVMADYDSLVSFEGRLLSHVRKLAYVDGHDFGCDEFNIFILTDYPVETYQLAEELRRSEFKHYVPGVAYRELTSEEFIVLSPPFLIK